MNTDSGCRSFLICSTWLRKTSSNAISQILISMSLRGSTISLLTISKVSPISKWMPFSLIWKSMILNPSFQSSSWVTENNYHRLSQKKRRNPSKNSNQRRKSKNLLLRPRRQLSRRILRDSTSRLRHSTRRWVLSGIHSRTYLHQMLSMKRKRMMTKKSSNKLKKNSNPRAPQSLIKMLLHNSWWILSTAL